MALKQKLLYIAAGTDLTKLIRSKQLIRSLLFSQRWSKLAVMLMVCSGALSVIPASFKQSAPVDKSERERALECYVTLSWFSWLKLPFISYLHGLLKVLNGVSFIYFTRMGRP